MASFGLALAWKAGAAYKVLEAARLAKEAAAKKKEAA